MKKFYFLLMTVLVSVSLWAQLKTWNGGNGLWTDGSKWVPAGTPVSGSFIVFSDGSTAVISNVPTITLKRITVTGNTGITLQSTAANVLTIDDVKDATEFVIHTGSSLAIGTNVDITLNTKSTANITGVLTINAGRTYSTDGNSNVAGTIDNKGVINSKSKNFSFSSGGTYIHSQNDGIVPDADWSVNSKCIVTGVENKMPTGLDKQEFGNFTWNSPGQTAILSFDRELKKIKGDLTITSTGTGSISLATIGNFTTVVDGDYIQTGGTLVINQTSGDGKLAIEGNFNLSGGVLAKGNSIPTSSSTVLFGGDNLHTFTKTGGTITGKLDFEVPTGNSIDFGQSILDGSAATFTLRPGAKIITSNANGLNSTGALGSIQTGVRSFSPVADYEFRGANTGVFNTGSSTISEPSIVRNLTINNSSGSITLSKPVTINDPNGALLPISRLYLENGILITTAPILLTLNDGVQATGVPGLLQNNYNLTSFVDGPLKKVGDNAFTFPVGKIGSGLHKIGITDPVGGSLPSTFFIAEFFRANPQTLSNTLEPGLTRISACEYWTLDRTGTNEVRVVLSWESNSGCQGSYVTNPLTLRVAHLVGTTWMDEGNQTGNIGGNSNAAGTITSSDVITEFSPFALASSSAIDNPLPVVFANVKAYEKNKGVQVEWSNLTEKDVASYTIERSVNGRDFSAIGQQLPASNQNDKADYDAFDATPIAGINYYRIKAEETTGKIVYSKILSVDMDNVTSGLRLYPNPVSGNQVTISLTNVKRGQYSLRVINNAGQNVFKQMITNHGSSLTQTLDLPLSVKPGVYNMVVTGNDYRYNKMFIVQ